VPGASQCTADADFVAAACRSGARPVGHSAPGRFGRAAGLFRWGGWPRPAAEGPGRL